MLRWRWLCLPLAVVAAGSAAAENSKALTLKSVIELAHARSPQARVARARADETRSGLVGARVWSTENPSLEGSVGPRWGGSRDAGMLIGRGGALPLPHDGREALARQWQVWRADATARDRAGRAAAAVVSEGTGAAERTTTLVRLLVESGG